MPSSLTTQPARRGLRLPGVDRHDLLLLTVALIWGGNGVSSKYLLATLSPLALLSIQAVGVALLLVVTSLGLRRGPLLGPAPMLRAFLFGGLILAVQRYTWFLGLRLSTASETALVMSTTPIWTALLVLALGLEIIRPHNWLGIFLALGGVALVVFGAVRASVEYAPAPLLGSAVLLCSALLVAVYTVVSKPWMERFGSLRYVTACHVVTALLILPLGAVPAWQAPWAELSGLHYFALFYTLVLAGGYGFAVWYLTVKRTSAARVNMYHYLLPVVTVTGAWLLLGEHLTGWQLLGFAVALVGVYLARPVPLARVNLPAPEKPC